MYKVLRSFRAKVWAGVVVIATLCSILVPIYQEFIKKEETQPTKVVNITQERALDLEMRDSSYQISIDDAQKGIFVVPGAFAVFRSVIANNSDQNLTSCVLKYDYQFENYNEEVYYNRTKAMLKDKYYTLPKEDRFEVRVGGYYYLNKPDDVFTFDLNKKTDKEMSFVTEAFFSSPKAIRFFVSCDQKISNKVVFNKDDTIVIHHKLNLPNWYYDFSSVFVAPYR
ncbi:TPA: hypothetical protein I7120_23030 [Vibrio vulnificus]|nr:hypothetical protein [Vibrio vulnificus]